MNDRPDRTKVLQLIGSFHSGGSERQTVQLSRLLTADGEFDVALATLNKEGVLLDQIDFIDHKEILEYKISSFLSAGFLWRALQLRRRLVRENIKIVHTHDFYSNVFAAAAVFGLGKISHIASKRETGGMRSPNQTKLENMVFRLARAVTVNAKAVKDHLIASGVAEQKIEIIYNGIDLQRFTTTGYRNEFIARSGFAIGADDDLVTIVANLRHEVKNITMLLRTAARVAGSRSNVKFLIAGEGPLMPDLKKMARELGVENNVIFLGRCDDVPNLLSVSDICVLTSTAEGFSNSILEYMAAGKPVVVTDVGGAAEAVDDGVTGYIVASDDDRSMAEHILNLLDNETRRQKMGDLARRRVEEMFSIKAQINSVKEIYRRFTI